LSTTRQYVGPSLGQSAECVVGALQNPCLARKVWAPVTSEPGNEISV
jgi:hypothetical protein